MPSLGTGQVRAPVAYEPDRAESLRRLAETKRERRVALGDLLTIVFENHVTLRGVVEETLRSERIEDQDEVAAEVAAFAKLVPGADELCAMSVLEVEDQAELSRRQAELDGVIAAIRLTVGDAVIEPANEHHTGMATAGLGYLRFGLDAQHRRDLANPDLVVALDVDHPAYRAHAELTGPQRRQLLSDLAQ